MIGPIDVVILGLVFFVTLCGIGVREAWFYIVAKAHQKQLADLDRHLEE